MSDWIQTHSGFEFDPLRPDPDKISIEDIAHGTSKCCRFQKQCHWFYSTAEHSVHCARQFSDPRDQKIMLLHDASDAYLPDVASPMKARLPGFQEIEDRLMHTIARKFNIMWPMNAEQHAVDKRMQETERLVLFNKYKPWKQPLAPYMDGKIYCWPPYRAYEEFMKLWRSVQ